MILTDSWFGFEFSLNLSYGPSCFDMNVPIDNDCSYDETV